MAQSKELLDCAILSAQRALEDFEFIQPVQPHQCRESSHGSGQTDSPPRKTLGRLYQSAEKNTASRLSLILIASADGNFDFAIHDAVLFTDQPQEKGLQPVGAPIPKAPVQFATSPI